MGCTTLSLWPSADARSEHVGGCATQCAASRKGLNMFKETRAFSGFSVDDLAAAKAFYGGTPGLHVEENPAGLTPQIPRGNGTPIYPTGDHAPPTPTTLNFP